MDKIRLNTKEKLLIEEYKLGLDAYYRSETIYSSRENFFFVAESIIAVVAVELLQKIEFIIFNILFILFLFGGIGISYVWYQINKKSSQLSEKRLKRLEYIENKVPANQFDTFMFFNKTKIQIPSISTWKYRLYLPQIFLFIWISFLIVFVFYHFVFLKFNSYYNSLIFIKIILEFTQDFLMKWLDCSFSY